MSNEIRDLIRLLFSEKISSLISVLFGTAMVVVCFINLGMAHSATGVMAESSARYGFSMIVFGFGILAGYLLTNGIRGLLRR